VTWWGVREVEPNAHPAEKAVKERKWGGEEDGVGYGKNGVIIRVPNGRRKTGLD